MGRLVRLVGGARAGDLPRGGAGNPVHAGGGGHQLPRYLYQQIFKTLGDSIKFAAYLKAEYSHILKSFFNVTMDGSAEDEELIISIADQCLHDPKMIGCFDRVQDRGAEGAQEVRAEPRVRPERLARPRAVGGV